jgi:hypothetical protein
MTTPETRTYFAISILSSRTFWFNAVSLFLAVLQLTEIVTLIPPRFLPLQLAIVAIGNMWLRTVTVRPAAFIAPGTTVGIQVAKIDPPPPAALTD